MKVIARWDEKEEIVTINEVAYRRGFIEIGEVPSISPPCARKSKAEFPIIRLYDTGLEKNNMRIYAPL